MFRSQFEECSFNDSLECDQIDYDWIWDWNDDEYIAEIEAPILPDTMSSGQQFTIEGYSALFETWTGDEEYCDTLVDVTLTLKNPPMFVDDFCGVTLIQLDSVLYFDDGGPFKEYPPIVTDSTRIKIIDCQTGMEILSSVNPITFPATISSYCLSVEYYHIDGAWWDWELGRHTHGSGDDPFIWTTSYYGPYVANSSHNNFTPKVTGNTTFCANDLSGHNFEIINPIPGRIYNWNQSPAVAGITVTDVSAAGDGSKVTIDLDSSVGSGTCTNVFYTTICNSNSAVLELCFDLIPVPTVTLDPVMDICITDAPDPMAISVATITAQAVPSSNNYIYNWEADGMTAQTLSNNIDYAYPTSIMTQVSVYVEDTLSSCLSNVSVPIDLEVLEPLETPVLRCITVTESELVVGWEAVVGAIAYNVFVDGILVLPQLSSMELSYTVTGLSTDQTVNFAVQAEGVQPCFDSALSIDINCTTVNDPDLDGDGSPASLDCDDNNPAVFPGNAEICDGLDNNCDGQVDNANIIPTISCPASLSIECNLVTGLSEITTWLSSATAQSSGQNLTVENNFTPILIQEATCESVIDVTFFATNLCGNQATCSSTVTVVKQQAPILNIATSQVFECDGTGNTSEIQNFISAIPNNLAD